jgi:hypothetical protein
VHTQVDVVGSTPPEMTGMNADMVHIGGKKTMLAYTARK